MVAGFAAFVLIIYNGIIDKPGAGAGRSSGVSLAIGYWVALLRRDRHRRHAASCARWQAGGRQQRKAPARV